MMNIGCMLVLLLASPNEGASQSTEAAYATSKPRIVRTMEMNPEEPLEIEGWWSDGTHLLEIRPSGDYRIWSTLDRFRTPADVGRWHRENHAVFWLESYRIPKEPRQRVPLWLRDGSLMATLDPDEEAYSKMLVPPSVPAESLIGTWTCADHQLRFTDDLRWNHRLGGVKDETPVRRDVEAGTWWMPLDGSLHMRSTTSHRPPITGLLRDDQGNLIGLESPFGVFARVQPPPKIDRANPEDAVDETKPDVDRSAIPPSSSS